MRGTDEIYKAFDTRARGYAAAARFQQECGNRLSERLDYLKFEPGRILDLGCGPGIFSQALAKRYPESLVTGLDIAPGMLAESRRRQPFWRKRWALVQADMHALPFADASVDMVFANQVVHWANTLSAIFAEIHRVLRPGGCLYFSTLGPDTFCELVKAWAVVDRHAHVNAFADMHDVGDALLQAGFLDPVMDMEKLVFRYPDLGTLLQSLKAQGVRNIHQGRNRGLTGIGAWRSFERAYGENAMQDGKCPLTYEVVCGHAWKGQPRQQSLGHETYIPLSDLQRSPGKVIT